MESYKIKEPSIKKLIFGVISVFLKDAEINSA